MKRLLTEAGAHATAITTALTRLWPTIDASTADWNRLSFGTLAALGRQSFQCEAYHSPKWGGPRERLFDFLWYRRHPTTGLIVAIPLVCESEWTASGVHDDFEKLLYANAPLRLMIFEHHTRAEVLARVAELQCWSRAYRHPVTARYLAAGWVNREPTAVVCRTWEVEA